MEGDLSLRIDPTGLPASARSDNTIYPSKEEADTQRVRGACKDFESIFIYQLLSSIRRAFKTDDDSDSGFGSDLFRSMMDEQLSIAIAKAGGIGLADILEKGLGLVDSARESMARLARVSPSPARPKDSPEASSDRQLRPYESTIRAASRVFGIDANLLRAVILHESSGNPKAVSSRGAKGLMQLMDATAAELGVSNPFDPVQNIFGGARLLTNLLKVFDGDLELALASYNAGEGAVRRYGGIPPYKETQEYVRKVSSTLQKLSNNGDTASITKVLAPNRSEG
jgi:soluble lytic murein transglycosylase-like protein